MDVFASTDYKALIRARVKELSRLGRKITLAKLAAKIPVQATYLSKALNDEKTHLNEDHLFSVCAVLELLSDETEYVFLLRSHATTTHPARRAHLEARIERLRRSRELNAAVQEHDSRSSTREMAYLFDPHCVLVHVALSIREYKENPRRLCAALGLTPARLQEILRKLHTLGFVEMDTSGKVTAILRGQIHYGTDHPLMRAHQSLLRQYSAARVVATPETDKHCFMATFSTDEETFRAIQERARALFQEVERHVIPSRRARVYQLNFDLFPWF